ncbi:MAG: co-chaperone GroES [Planctomycetota bacterium]
MATKTAIKVRPLGNKVLIQRDEAETQTDAGIYLPESAKDTPRTGVITAVGTGAINTETGERIELSLKKGERVIFSSYSGTEIKLEGADGLLIMGEDEILAVID